MARRCAREEGMLVGISSGATLAAIAQKLPQLPAGTHVLGFNYDTGERYLSIEGFLPTQRRRPTPGRAQSACARQGASAASLGRSVQRGADRALLTSREVMSTIWIIRS